ncbi:MAG: hypothetical protein IPK19_36095 [Chloroflexi bacterium]|nr:hypothetical protein [Chloroflexota bacterium]
MSVQSLNRWGGAFILVVAAITLVGGLIRFAALEMNAGNLVLGQALYTGASLVGGFAFVALYAPRATRMGKLGFAGFIFSFLGVSLNITPAFLWLASVTGQEWGHAALMYAWGTVPLLVVGTFSSIIGHILFGIAAARSGAYPRWAAYALIASAVVDLPVELPMFGAMFTSIWPLSLVLYVVALAWMGYTVVRSGVRSPANSVASTGAALA